MYTGTLEDVKEIKDGILEWIPKSREQLDHMRNELLPLIFSDKNTVLNKYPHFPLYGFKDEVAYPFETLQWCYGLLAKNESDPSKRVDYSVKSNIARNLFEEGVGIKNRFTRPMSNDAEKILIEMETLVTETELYLAQAQYFLETIKINKIQNKISL